MAYAGYIDGVFVEGDGARLVVQNPSDETIVADYSGLSAEQVASAIASSRRAFDKRSWSKLPARERAAILRRFNAALAARTRQIEDIEVAEAGCPRASGVMHAQVASPIRQADQIVDLFLTLPEVEENPLPLEERVNPLGQVIQSLRRYSPIGVVAGIAAYNFPFYTALWKVLPALVTGNTIVLRPNPLTPLSAMVFAEAAHDAGLPPGVLNVVTESGLDGGKLLSTDARVDMVAFTGSSAVGVDVMVQGAPTMKRLQLELGGKSAQIYLPDSAEKAVAGAAMVCHSHAGQGCALGTRVFVPQDRKEELLAQMARQFEAIRVGHAEDPNTQMGPVISAGQRERCERYVRLALEGGARLVAGGKRPEHLSQGFFFQPTLLDAPDNGNPAAQDEIFGPVVTVIGYRDIDHAIEMANDSRFGLSGYVYGKDRKEALRVALAMNSGTVHVNAGVMSAYASAGGHRMSGIGRERGIEGIRIFQQLGCLTLGAG